MECTSAFYARAALLHALHTGGIKMNTWAPLHLCRLIDGSQTREIPKQKREWQNYRTIYRFTDAILSSTAQRLALRSVLTLFPFLAIQNKLP